MVACSQCLVTRQSVMLQFVPCSADVELLRFYAHFDFKVFVARWILRE